MQFFAIIVGNRDFLLVFFFTFAFVSWSTPRFVAIFPSRWNWANAGLSGRRGFRPGGLHAAVRLPFATNGPRVCPGSASPRQRGGNLRSGNSQKQQISADAAPAGSGHLRGIPGSTVRNDLSLSFVKDFCVVSCVSNIDANKVSRREGFKSCYFYCISQMKNKI